jgi:hypothetical protein
VLVVVGATVVGVTVVGGTVVVAMVVAETVVVATAVAGATEVVGAAVIVTSGAADVVVGVVLEVLSFDRFDTANAMPAPTTTTATAAAMSVPRFVREGPGSAPTTFCPSPTMCCLPCARDPIGQMASSIA